VLATGLFIASVPASAQSVTNLYPGTTSIYLPYINGRNDGQIGTPPQIGVSFGDSRALTPFVMDTGSVGIAVSTDIYKPTGPSLGPGSITYTSSGKIEEGYYYNASVNLFNGGKIVATADVPILSVDAIACLPDPRNCTPTDHPTGVSQMGIGFGQESAGQPNGTPAANPS
jgi:hypothetical protein